MEDENKIHQQPQTNDDDEQVPNVVERTKLRQGPMKRWVGNRLCGQFADCHAVLYTDSTFELYDKMEEPPVFSTLIYNMLTTIPLWWGRKQIRPIPFLVRRVPWLTAFRHSKKMLTLENWTLSFKINEKEGNDEEEDGKPKIEMGKFVCDQNSHLLCASEEDLLGWIALMFLYKMRYMSRSQGAKDAIKEHKEKLKDKPGISISNEELDDEELFKLFQGKELLKSCAKDQSEIAVLLLHYAARWGKLGLLEKLHDDGWINTTSVNAPITIDGFTLIAWTPLQGAIRHGHTDVARWLLDNGASIDAKVPIDIESCQKLSKLTNGESSLCISTLQFAARYDRSLIAKMLVDKGANLNERDPTGCTPLHEAVAFGSLQTIGFLLHTGADLNAKDFSGCNGKGNMPLHLAARSGQIELLQYLMDFGIRNGRLDIEEIMELGII